MIMKKSKFTFWEVKRIEGETVSLMDKSQNRRDALKLDFYWDVQPGDMVCMQGCFIHSKVANAVGQ